MIGIDEIIEIGGIVFFIIELIKYALPFIKASKYYKLLLKPKYDKIDLITIIL